MNMNSSLSQELTQNVATLSDAVDSLVQVLADYANRHARDLYPENQDRKKQATDYYLLSAELAARIQHCEETVSTISALTLRADKAIMPELVGRCDSVFEQYVAFRRQINAFLQENDGQIRADSDGFSVAKLHGSVREMKFRADAFQAWLRASGSFT